MSFFFSILTLFLFFINPVHSEQKIVFVDMDKIISTSKPGVSILKQLNVINNKNIVFFKKEEKKFKQNETKLISQKNIISETDFKKKVDILRLEINKYNQNRKKIIRDFNQLKVDSTNKLVILINPILSKFSKDNEISVILQKKNLIIGKISLDITDKIIKIINEEIDEIKIR